MSLWILNWIWLGKETDVVADIEQQPSVSELSKALGDLKSGKAEGSCFLVKVVGSDRELCFWSSYWTSYTLYERKDRCLPMKLLSPSPSRVTLVIVII